MKTNTAGQNIKYDRHEALSKSLTATATTTSIQKTTGVPHQLARKLISTKRKERELLLLTLMTIEDLHNFSSLQIPQVDFAIFAAGHDPFASGDAEACPDAVLGVLVTDVGL